MKIELILSSPPDRENVVVELWADDEQIAEVSYENSCLCVELYCGTSKSLCLEYDELVYALEKARHQLVS